VPEILGSPLLTEGLEAWLPIVGPLEVPIHQFIVQNTGAFPILVIEHLTESGTFGGLDALVSFTRIGRFHRAILGPDRDVHVTVVVYLIIVKIRIHRFQTDAHVVPRFQDLDRDICREQQETETENGHRAVSEPCLMNEGERSHIYLGRLNVEII
jgi:hypothetical protein